MSTLEVILRTLGVGQLVVLAVILLRTRRRDQTARIGAALCVSVAAFMLTSMPGAAHVLGVIVYPLTALCATHPVWFWLFCAALFADGFRLGRGHVLCLVAMAVVGVLYQALIQTVIIWRVAGARGRNRCGLRGRIARVRGSRAACGPGWRTYRSR